VILDFVARLKNGLSKTRERIHDLLDEAVGRGVFDDRAAEEIEEALLAADAGPEIAAALVEELREWVRDAGGGVTAATVREALAMKIERRLRQVEVPPIETAPPRVTLVIGVNGVGKTTTAAKLAAQMQAAGRNVLLGAADTFRAAAVEQPKVWGERIGVPVVAQAEGADPAAVAFDAVQAGIARKVDEVIIDTAGRLHTKSNLMKELEKVGRVVRKLRDPIEALLVLDATTGQNGILQVESFASAIPLTGLVITKLDGSARAGVVLEAVRRFRVPVRHIGVGESVEDLLPFDAKAFAEEFVA
jgi:fused signal recognition particle receptor